MERQIGQGGMANVYLAVQESVERQVALKVMSPVLLVDNTFTERFMREAKIAANLSHQNVVSIFDVAVEGNNHYIAMEYLPGGDLSHACDGKAMDLARAIRVTREIASALDYAHQKGFVHRDVKPENILFREDDSSVLTDFGIARAVNSATQMTRTGAVIGTPQYMSPEQARGRDLDGRSDLYALGVVFFEMLTGGVPYEGNDSIAVGIKHITEPLPVLPEHIEFLQPVIEKFLAKKPEGRYQTGAECVNQLKRIEKQMHTGEQPAVQLGLTTPGSSSSKATRISQPPPVVADVRPIPKNEEAKLSEANQYTGRQEPSIGSFADVEGYRPRSTGEQSKPGKKRTGLFVLLALILGLGAGAWVFRDQLQRFIPNQEVSRLLQAAQTATEYGFWFGENEQYASFLYAQVLSLDPGNETARAGQSRVVNHLVEQAQSSLNQDDLQSASRFQTQAKSIMPQHPALLTLSARMQGESINDAAATEPQLANPQLTKAQQIADLIADSKRLANQGKLLKPENDSAFDRLSEVLVLAPGNSEAEQGLSAIRGKVVNDLEAAIAASDFALARSILTDLSRIADKTVIDQYSAQLDESEWVYQQQALQLEQEQAQLGRTNQLLEKAAAAYKAQRLTQPDSDNAVFYYRQVLELDPVNQVAATGLSQVARRMIGLAANDLEEDLLDQAEAKIALAESIDSTIPDIVPVRKRLQTYLDLRQTNQPSGRQQIEVEGFLVSAEDAMRSGLLMGPPGRSAFDFYKSVLRLDPDNQTAIDGLNELSRVLLDQSRTFLLAGELDNAKARLNDAQQTDPQNTLLPALQTELASSFRRRCRELIQLAEIDRAEALMLEAAALAPDHPDLETLRTELSIAKEEAET